MRIFARNTVRNSIVVRATPNSTGENGDKKQNTLPYTLQFRRKEVCLVGAGDESVLSLWKITAFAIINCSANFTKNDYQSFFIRKIPPRSSTLLHYLCQKEKRTALGAFLFLEQVTRVAPLAARPARQLSIAAFAVRFSVFVTI